MAFIERREPILLKIQILNFSDAEINEVKLLSAYYAATFLHFRNEIWMSDILDERLRTLPDKSGVMLILEEETFAKWKSFTGVEVLRDVFQLNGRDQIKFATTVLRNFIIQLLHFIKKLLNSDLLISNLFSVFNL